MQPHCGRGLEVDDLSSEVEALRDTEAHLRNEIVGGRGGKQILVEDPSGNPIELFEPQGTDAAPHRCWTKAMRTSENPQKAKFVEFLFHALR